MKSLHKFIGKTALTLTPICMTGKILIEGEIHDAISIISVIKKDAKVTVMGVSLNFLEVERIELTAQLRI